jgi:cytoskeleton-associated protein 5
LYDLVEAVEVFSKFTDSWCEKAFQLEKWMEKKE